MELSPTVRPLPLKIAGGIGLLVTSFYLAVAVGQDEGIGPAIFWLVIMAAGALLAWYAGQFEQRKAAMAAAGIFFVLGLVSPFILALAFLVAVVFCVIGFVDFGTDES